MTSTPPSLPGKPEDSISVHPVSTVDFVQPTSIVDFDKLEYPVVPSNVADPYRQFEVELPAYFKELPKSKLDELYKDKSLLRGYLLAKYGEHYQTPRDSIVEDLRKQQEYCERRCESNDKSQRVEKINGSLKEYHALLDKFNSSQVAMYDKLNRMSKKAMIEMMEADLSRQEERCQSIVDDVMVIPGEVSDEEVTKFIERYKEERQRYYLKREKLSRMFEDRVGQLES
ncbi:DEKNAAC102176 [Brettanomyces naardenensis]|uniref:DEKNAAC102176 n=1 Tax=Brettanomyces naardenensis TaxID=13370 RepID=A0A448YJZ3_BRENA|nr:DEKNAAC102176 [Brettanomyces naardenensis]